MADSSSDMVSLSDFSEPLSPAPLTHTSIARATSPSADVASSDQPPVRARLSESDEGHVSVTAVRELTAVCAHVGGTDGSQGEPASDGTHEQRADESELVALMRLLQDERDIEAAAGRYLNAAVAQERLCDVVASEEYAVLLRMHQTHEDKERELETRGTDAFLDTEASWVERLAGFDAHVANLAAQMRAKHDRELAALWTAMAAEPFRPRFSPALLDVRRRELKAARAGDFTLAATLQREADDLESFETAKSQAAREKAHARRAAALLAELARREAGLMQRAELFRQNATKRGQMQLATISARTAAARWEFGVRAAAEKARVERYFHNVVSIDRSKVARARVSATTAAARAALQGPSGKRAGAPAPATATATATATVRRSTKAPARGEQGSTSRPVASSQR